MPEPGLAKRLRIAQLTDVYGVLLTDHQQRLLRRYFLDDLSLGEMAGELAVTRQAVSDSLRRATAELEHFETMLQLLAARQRHVRRRRALIAHLDALDRAVAQLNGRRQGQALVSVRGAVRRLRQSVSVQ